MLGMLLVIGFLQASEPAQQGAVAPLPSVAQSESAAATTHTAQSERRVCRRANRANSRLGGRVCRTETEWRDEEERNRLWMEEAQRAGSINNPPGDQHIRFP